MIALPIAVAVVSVANLVLLLRWQKRQKQEISVLQYEIRRVHKEVASGRQIIEADRPAAALDAEQSMLALPNCVLMLLLAANLTIGRSGNDTADTFFLISGFVMAALGLLFLAIVSRHLLKARRQGIRPRPPWR